MSFDHMSFDHMSFDPFFVWPYVVWPYVVWPCVFWPNNVGESLYYNTRNYYASINVQKDQIFDFRKVYFKVEVYHKRFKIVEVISQGLEFISRLKGNGHGFSAASDDSEPILIILKYWSDFFKQTRRNIRNLFGVLIVARSAG